MPVESNIVQILKKNAVDYEATEHEPVYTNPAMAEALGVSEGETVKSLVLPGDKKVDWKKAAAGIGTKKVSFAKPDQVSEKVGCEVGCVPPFGQLTPLPVYMDKDLISKGDVYFNPGVHHKSFKIKAWDLKKLCNPKII
jgi:Ala-tRNA(Pro) deacylase